MALIATHLNAGHAGGDIVAIGIYAPSSHTSIPPSPPFSWSLISLMVSVDVKHRVYLLTSTMSIDSVSIALLSLPQVKFHQQKALACHSTATLTQALHLLRAAIRKNHSTAKASGMFHLALEGSVTSFWQPASLELSAFPVHRLSRVEDLQWLEVEGPVGVVVDVTCPDWLGEEEVRCQTRLLDVVLHVCSVSSSREEIHSAVMIIIICAVYHFYPCCCIQCQQSDLT